MSAIAEQVRLAPIRQKAADAFLAEHRRDNRNVPGGGVIRVALRNANDDVVAVAVAGRPSDDELDDGVSLEVTCVGALLAAPTLYEALGRAAAALGYRTLWTYSKLYPGPVADFFVDGYTDEGRTIRWRRDL